MEGRDYMKYTAWQGQGIRMKCPTYYLADKDRLRLKDGTEIAYESDENFTPNDCFNYADWSALSDTGFFEDDSVSAETLKLERTDYGFRINGYFVPCYSAQNGYYTDDLSVYAVKDGEVIARLEAKCGRID